MICTLAVFKAGALILGVSVTGLDADGCRAWSDEFTRLGYSVRREWHKPERCEVEQ